MSRYPIRARVLKRENYWLVVLPTGRRVVYGRWAMAMYHADEAVRKERRFTALQEFASREYIGQRY